MYVQIRKSADFVRSFMYTRPTDMPDGPQLPPKLFRVELRIARSDLHAWREAAVREKQKLSEWIRCACDEYMAKSREVRKQ
jgi:hypothetical protein